MGWNQELEIGANKKRVESLKVDRRPARRRDAAPRWREPTVNSAQQMNLQRLRPHSSESTSLPHPRRTPTTILGRIRIPQTYRTRYADAESLKPFAHGPGHLHFKLLSFTPGKMRPGPRTFLFLKTRRMKISHGGGGR